MRFVSTGGKAPPAGLKEALFGGLAPDGGLYVPETLPRLPARVLAGLKGQPLERTALAIAKHLLADALTGPQLQRLIDEALGFPIPLVPVGERAYALELFHGPTCAFKDVGARFLARLMARFRAATDPPLTVLVATSGDTGGAVAQAFFGQPGVQVVVLYPEGKVSRLQEHQFATLGRNVTAVAVDGTFDDCQRLVKQAFADPELQQQQQRGRLRLASANSISIGRLLPQIFYYFHAWAQLSEPPAELIVSVPSGNFGNLTAGLMAKRLGLPVSRFIAATNVNDVVPVYLATGTFTPRPSVGTLTSAMDVGNPSNVARMLALYDGNVSELKADVEACVLTDAQTRAAMGQMYRDHGYVLDPHSAVAAAGLWHALSGRPQATGVFLATAHPGKFADAVEAAIQVEVKAPARLAECLTRQPRAARARGTLEELRSLLLSL